MSATVNANLVRASRRLQAARDRLSAAMGTASAAAIDAANDGMPETAIAAALGVNRSTVREWIGKPRRRTPTIRIDPNAPRGIVYVGDRKPL